MKIKSFIILLAMVAQTVSAQSLFMKECRQRHFPKEIPPGNYSGITYLGHNDYAVVSDKSEEDGFFRRNRQTLWGGCTDANPKLLLNDT